MSRNSFISFLIFPLLAWGTDQKLDSLPTTSSNSNFLKLCQELLKRKTILSPPIAKVVPIQASNESQKRPTVQVTFVPLPREHYELSKAANDSWHSGYTEYVNDVHGNPKTFINLTHPKFARSAGLYPLSPNALYVDLPEQLGETWRLKTAEGSPDLAFLVSFYSTNGIMSGRVYIEKFVKESALPISTTSVMVHDLAYHLPFFLATPAIVRHIQSQGKLGLELIDDLEKKGLSPSEIDKIIEAYEEHIDLATGGFEYSYRTMDPRPRHLWSPMDVLSNILNFTDLSSSTKRQIIEFMTSRRGLEWTQRKMSKREFVYQVRLRRHQIANL